MLVNDVTGTSQAESHILHPGTRELYSYWEKIRAENAAPNRASIDLRQISRIVPDLMMMERDNMRQSYKWRLAGTSVCRLYQKELTYSDAFTGWGSFERDILKKLFDTVVTSLQPCLVRMRLTTNTDEVIGAEMLGLPLQSGNGSRFHIFGGVFPFRDVAALHYQEITKMELSGARTIWTEHLPGDKLVAALNTTRTFGGLRLVQGGKD